MKKLTLSILLIWVVVVGFPSFAQVQTAPTEWKVQTLVAFVSKDLDGFWSQIFENSNRTYLPLTSISAYVDTIDTACGESKLNNAFYCTRSHSIHYDLNFLDDVLNNVGDFAVATIIAHEWAHSIQNQLGILSRFTIRSEQQADCLAGAYAKHAEEIGILEQGDLDEGKMLLAKLGDPPGTPRLSRGAHGSAAERVFSFETGFQRGINGCF